MNKDLSRITIAQYLRTNVFMAMLLAQFIIVPMGLMIVLLVSEFVGVNVLDVKNADEPAYTDILAFMGGLMLVGGGFVLLATKLEVRGIQTAMKQGHLYKATIRYVRSNKFTVFIKPDGLGLANSFPIIVFANRRTRAFAAGDTITLIESWRFSLPSPTRVPLESLFDASLLETLESEQ